MTRQYIYRVASVVRVVDGDTAWLSIDVGFRQSLLANVRLLGCDTPERNSASAFERAEAKRATAFTETWLTRAPALWIETHKDPDSFGRWLGDLWRDDDETHLAAALVDAGLATLWPMRWRTRYDP